MSKLETKIERLAEIKREIAILKTEADTIEGEVMKAADERLVNTKYKSVTMNTEKASCTATTAYKAEIIYETLLPFAFGQAAGELYKRKECIELTSKGKELVTILLSGSFIEADPQEVIENLTADEVQRRAVIKKCKGKNFSADTAALLSLGFDDAAAKETAYLLNEAVNYQKVKAFLNIVQKPLDKVINDFKTAFALEATTRITVE